MRNIDGEIANRMNLILLINILLNHVSPDTYNEFLNACRMV